MNVGLDEAGKGEYFGPLVIAGFYMENKQSHIEDLQFVDDSKKFSKKKINNFFQYINFHYPNNFMVKIIEPKTYNQLYEIKQNQLHIITDVYSEIIQKFYDVKNLKNFIIDKYSSSRYTYSTFNEQCRKNNINIYEENKADLNYLSVSVASIIAKYYYNHFIYTKSQEYGIDMSVGSSNKAIPTARKISEIYSFNELQNFVKMHFKLTKRI